MTSIVIGSVVLASVAASTANSMMHRAAKEKFKSKVKTIMKETNNENFDVIAMGEVSSFRQTRELRMRGNSSSSSTSSSSSLPSSSSTASSSSSIANRTGTKRKKKKKNGRRVGKNRTLAVIQQKNNGAVYFILFKHARNSRTNKNGRHFVDKNNDGRLSLNGCSTVDPHFKSNQGGIIESRSVEVTKKGGGFINNDCYRFEDTNYRPMQTHRKIFELTIRRNNNISTTTTSGRNELCELLDSMAAVNKGNVTLQRYLLSPINTNNNKSTTMITEKAATTILLLLNLKQQDDDEDETEHSFRTIPSSSWSLSSSSTQSSVYDY